MIGTLAAKRKLILRLVGMTTFASGAVAAVYQPV